MLNRRAFSDLIPENVHGSRRKEEARQSEFLRIGQVGVVFSVRKRCGGDFLEIHTYLNWASVSFNYDAANSTLSTTLKKARLLIQKMSFCDVAFALVITVSV